MGCSEYCAFRRLIIWIFKRVDPFLQLFQIAKILPLTHSQSWNGLKVHLKAKFIDFSGRIPFSRREILYVKNEKVFFLQFKSIAIQLWTYTFSLYANWKSQRPKLVFEIIFSRHSPPRIISFLQHQATRTNIKLVFVNDCGPATSI